VDAGEAKEIGLANRVVPKGRALIEAEKLAEELVRFPQACMLADRKSTYEQFNLSINDALLMEVKRGSKVLQTESIAGARQFAVEVRIVACSPCLLCPGQGPTRRVRFEASREAVGTQIATSIILYFVPMLAILQH
jgi:hypothetical protein